MKWEQLVNEVHCADALHLLDEIPGEKIDIVLTDPPYFLDKLDSNWDEDVVSNEANQYAVKSLPAGMKFDSQQGKRLYDWYLEVSKKLHRVLKPGGFFFSFSSPRLYHRIASAIDDAGFDVRDCFIWLYTQNQPKAMSLNHFIQRLDVDEATKQHLRHELHGWKTPQVKSCFEPIAVAQKEYDGTFLRNMIAHRVGLFNTRVPIGQNMFPANVLAIEQIEQVIDKYFLVNKPTAAEKGQYNTHKTVKPLAVCEYIIQLAAFAEDAIVLDPFVDSGTTVIAARKLGKRFIGIDINPEYVEIARRRLSEIDAAPRRPEPQPKREGLRLEI